LKAYSKSASLFYNALISLLWLTNHKTTSLIWNKLWSKSCQNISATVYTVIHNHKVLVNFGHPYPIISRQYRLFNNPLIELTYQAYAINHTPIIFVDVGAGVGDTVLLVNENCPEMVKKFYCVDGDPEFFEYLQHNLYNLSEKKLFLALLSSSCDKERALIRTHKGTASAQGQIRVPSNTLSSLILPEELNRIDLIKIDVDGFDGKVLLGARKILDKYKPAVIFEWHPKLCKEAGNNWTDHFNVLKEAGYSKFIWFNKFGEFSHFMECCDTRGIDRLAEFCLNSHFYYDWHYDIIALHDKSLLSPIALAEASYAKSRRSRY
jgi:FkbM family methyltransferase